MKKISCVLLALFFVQACWAEDASSKDWYLTGMLGTVRSDVDRSEFPLVGSALKNDEAWSSGLLVGWQATPRWSLEFGAERLGNINSSSDSFVAMSQDTSSFFVQARYRLLDFDDWSVVSHIGLARWHSTLDQALTLTMGTGPFATGPPTSQSYYSSRSDHGFTPKFGLSVRKKLSENLAFSLEWDHMRKVGDNHILVDEYMLALGDLTGAVLGHKPIRFSTNRIGASLIYAF